MTSPIPRTPTVFVGGPFKAYVDPVSGTLAPAFRLRYERLIAYFEKGGATVLNAHREEGWGTAMVSAGECTERDLRWMRQCDLFVAFPGAPCSPGTHVEIGWASALGRPMVLVLEPSADYAALVTGLYGVAPVAYTVYEEGAGFDRALAEAVHELENLVKASWHWYPSPLAEMH